MGLGCLEQVLRLWQRLLGRPASESGRLRRKHGGQNGATATGRSPKVGYAPWRPNRARVSGVIGLSSNRRCSGDRDIVARARAACRALQVTAADLAAHMLDRRTGRRAMRTSLKMIVAVIGLLGASVSTADAADTLYTSAQLRAGRIFDCNVVNVGSSPVTVTVEFVTTFNTVELFSPDVVIPPGQIAPFSASSGPG